jgi:hypothetical protein
VEIRFVGHEVEALIPIEDFVGREVADRSVEKLERLKGGEGALLTTS